MDDKWIDALGWLEDAAEPAAGNPHARVVLDMIEHATATESTVLGMLMSPSVTRDLIRDYIIARSL